MEERTTSPTAPQVAAVDLGSNSFHMVVASLTDGHLRVLDRLREPVRLAGGLDEKNYLSEEAQTRALACLERFGQRLRGMAPGSVRAVGTNTLRKARGTGDFLARAEVALGHPIEIIAGREEARVIYLGVAHGMPDDGGRRLVVDIGGGSTEVIIGEGFEPLRRESLYMGCVSASRRYFGDGTIRAKAMREAVLAARLELEPVAAAYRRIGWGAAVGASGTIRAVADVVRSAGWSTEGITREALGELQEALVEAGSVERLKLPGLKEERGPVFPGGVAVLAALFEDLGIERLAVSDWALREGLLYDLVGRSGREDVRERTIAAMAKRYDVDLEQAQRVEATAQHLLREVAPAWGLAEASAPLLLGWASRLHEIGLAMAHSGYHKHGAYLLQNSDMPGFSTREQRRLAALVRAHRRKFPAAALADLCGAPDSALARLAVLLRLAVVLHRGRTEQEAEGLASEVQDETLRLRFAAQWLENHPLTLADLEQESAYLKAAGVNLRFE